MSDRRHLLINTPLAVAGAWCGAMGRLGQLQGDSTRLAPKAKRVVMIFNAGAPSHHDLFDPKPDAPESVRGPFRPIATRVPGIRFTELIPDLAARADKLALIRSLHHTHTQHNSGMHWSIVGKPYRIDSTLINPGSQDIPSIGTLVGWLTRREEPSRLMPPYVITPHPHCDSFAYITPGQFGGCLGREHDPLVVAADPAAKDFSMKSLEPSKDLPLDRMRGRDHLLGMLSEPAPVFDRLRRKASELVSTPAVRAAFELSREPAKVRDRYGRHTWGQSHLLARRLLEAGCRFVTTVNGPSIVWDTHKDNFNGLKNRLVPPMQRAFVALLDDLDERGMLEETLVVWLGDFGRTPTINADAGRDHWPQCYTAVVAGGGLKVGQTIGASDRIGAYPKDSPHTPADLHATILSALGYDPHSIFYPTPDGRTLPLSEGQPIRALLS